MTSTDAAVAPRRIPSVSELQAALIAAQAGQFATPTAAAPAPSRLVDPRPAAAGGARHDTSRPVAAAARAAGGDGLWLLGTHGGSGARCLSSVLPGTRRAGKQWPPARAAREPVVLVCRANHRGLTSAQDHARAYRDGGLGEGCACSA